MFLGIARGVTSFKFYLPFVSPNIEIEATAEAELVE